MSYTVSTPDATKEQSRTHYQLKLCPHQIWHSTTIPLQQAVCHVTLRQLRPVYTVLMKGICWPNALYFNLYNKLAKVIHSGLLPQKFKKCNSLQKSITQFFPSVLAAHLKGVSVLYHQIVGKNNSWLLLHYRLCHHIPYGLSSTCPTVPHHQVKMPTHSCTHHVKYFGGPSWFPHWGKQSKKHGLNCPKVSHDWKKGCVLRRDTWLLHHKEVSGRKFWNSSRDLGLRNDIYCSRVLH